MTEKRKQSAAKKDAAAQVQEKVQEKDGATPTHRCVHCDHLLAFEGEGEPTRCPSCLRKGGLEPLAAKAAPKKSLTVPLAVLGVVLTGAAAYAAMSSSSGGETASAEVPLVPLSPSDLMGRINAYGGTAEDAGFFEAGPGVRALAAAADGETPTAKADALIAHIRDARREGHFVHLPLNTPRDTVVREGEWAAAQLEEEGASRLYPLEVAVAAVAALREADVPAMVAEIWSLQGARAPVDPSGQMGYFGVAIPDGDGHRIVDVYKNQPVPDESARVLSDVQVVGAAISLRGLHRLVHENDSVRALSDIQTALSLDPRSPYIRTVRGTILTQSGGLEEGVQEFESAANLRRDAARRNNLAGLFIAMQRFDDADAAIAAALEESPDFAFAHANLAVIYLSKGEHASALSELEEAERLDSQLHVLPLLWAQYHLAQHDEAQTVRWVQTAIERNPRSLQTHLAAAEIYRAVGRTDHMRREVQATLELVPVERREAFRQEIRARLGAAALEAPSDPLEAGSDDLGLDSLDPLDSLDSLGDPLDIDLGGGGGLLGGSGGLGGGGGPSLLDEDLGGGGLGGGLGGGGLQLQEPGAGGGLQLRLGQ